MSTEITSDIEQKCLTAVDYLKSIEAYPNTQLLTLNEKKFTGQFISSVILAHIDLHNQFNSKSKLEHGSTNGSFSFQLEPDTFKYLYEIIEQLTLVETILDTNLDYILNVCLRLFTTHLQVLINANLEHFHEYLNENDIEKWFTLMLKLAFDDKSEERKKEASQGLIYLIEKRLSFGQMLTFIHKHIIENEHPILIDHLLNKLNEQIFIYKWIETLSDNQHTENITLSLTVLHSFIDIVLKSTFDDKEQLARLHEIVIMFQELLLVYLNNQCIDITDELESSGLSTLGIEYTTHLIQSSLQQDIQSILFEPLILGLCTLTEPKFNFSIIQPIFTAVMPLFAEYIVKQTNVDVDNKKYHLISWLLGKMSHRLIVGPPASPLEQKYNKTLKSSLFSGGCETLTTDTNSYLSNLFKSNLSIYSRFVVPFRRQESILDNQFLISIYNNQNPGAKLISRLKSFIRDKHIIPKSIENIVNDAFAAVFSVYIKHYRRIDLARHELNQSNEQKPHPKLLILYEYANEIRTIFSTTKARGDDCYQLCQQIKSNSLLLIISIRESSFITKIPEDFFSPSINKQKIQFQRQKSHWTKARSIIRLLRNTFNACIRFKYSILQNKRSLENKLDSESILHREISHFLYHNQTDSNEIVKCLTRQHQRAMTRFITHRFIQQLINSNNVNHILLFINLRDKSIDWHYLENIKATHYQLKEDIGQIYYQIIKNIFSFPIQSNVKIFSAFYLINLNYNSMDLSFLNHFQFIEQLFLSSIDPTNIYIKLTGFNWFRLVVLKLCQRIQLEKERNVNLGYRKMHSILQQQSNLIFNKLILNKLKLFQEDFSLKNSSLRSFVRSSNLNIDQYLILLLRCVHFYDHIRINCATIDYIQLLFNLYQTNQSLTTRLLTLRILRHLFICLTDETNRTFIENLLTEILFSIGRNFNLLENEKIDLQIIIELISIYRNILSQNSPWQELGTRLIIDGIQFDINSLETIEFKQMNSFLGSLCILGGFIQPFCLGSTVEIYSTNKDTNQFGIIIEVNIDDVKPYLVQYVTTNQTEWFSSNQIRIIVDVQPPNLLLLPIDNAVHIILDTLGFLAEKVDTLTIDSLILLDIKCRVVKVFYDLFNSKEIIEIFMEKPYASILGKLSTSMDNFDSIRNKIPKDLRLFNQLHLEQYYLSLDRFRRENEQIENKFDINNHNPMKIVRDPVVLEYLSELSSIDNEWNPISSEEEIKSYQNGRLGNCDIEIVCLPVNDKIAVLEECGIKHKFKGRIQISDGTETTRHLTFIPDRIELDEGKWFFCVKFPSGGLARIGWATKGFDPQLYGIGDDKYSWGFDGKRPVYDGSLRSNFFAGSWDKEAVCGCGIEIDGLNTNIKYWLNGEFLGTIFSHSKNATIESKVKRDLLPNGIFPTYFPGVSVKIRGSSAKGVFEFIFSPEDMINCPLPKGYKPLLMPKLLTMKNVFVPYPSNAFLIGNDIQQYFYTSRSPKNHFDEKKSSFLRDFVNEQHLEVPLNIDMITKENCLLQLSKENDGFLFPIDNHQELTISFHFEIIQRENPSDDLEIVLFKLDDTIYSIDICINDNIIHQTNKYRQHVVILFKLNEQTKVYINQKFQTLNYFHNFDPKMNSKLNLRFLPNLNVGIGNIGIWKYSLSDEHIQRLFTYNLSYVSIDYHKLKQHQQRFNTIRFKEEQKSFSNQILVPLNEPFQQDLWEQTKQSVIDDESIYFKTISDTNQSVVQLFGNKSYLVLNTSNEIWTEYTLIIDISIPNYPSDDQGRLTLLSLDDKSQIYITHDGHLQLTDKHQTSSIVKLQQYIRFIISVQQKSIQIYINRSLELDVSISENEFATKLKRIDLFRELDLTKNTTNDLQLRIQCQSITYLNRSMNKLTEYSLDQLVSPSFNILSTSLIGIGYNEQSIKYVINKFNTNNIYLIDQILREESQTIDQQQQQKRLDVVTRLTSYDQNQTLSLFIDTNGLSTSKIDNDDTPSDQKWFYDTVRSLGIRDTLDHWLRDREINNELTVEPPGCKFIDLTKVDTDQTELNKTLGISSHYEHRQIPLKSYIDSRRICEYGLITIYARQTILNIFKLWDNHYNLFPFFKFADANSFLRLFRVMHHHTFVDSTINRMDLLTISIITTELKDLVDEKMFNKKAPILFQLQKQVVEESIDLLSDPSLIDINNNNDATMDEQIFVKRFNLDFILNIFNLYFETLKHFQGKTDLIIRLLFPDVVIKILFDLFVLVPSHRVKKFILDIFTKYDRVIFISFCIFCFP